MVANSLVSRQTLDEWLAEMRAALGEFEVVYRKGMETLPEWHPQTLEAGEWDEQFQMFQATENGDPDA